MPRPFRRRRVPPAAPPVPPLALALALAFAPASASAQNPGRPSLTPAPAGDEPELAEDFDPDLEEAHPGVVRPAGADRLGGHLRPFAGGQTSFLVGSLAEGRPVGDRLGAGLGGTVGLALGLSRYVAAYASGAYEGYGGAGACGACTARAISVGAGLTYRLVQGSALVPHASFGLGYVALSVEEPGGAGAAVTASYRGLEFAKLGLGADFFPLPFLAVGPYAEANLGTYLGRPSAAAGQPDPGASVSARLALGLRLTIDLGGGMQNRRQGPASARPAAPPDSRPRPSFAGPPRAGVPGAALTRPSGLPSNCEAALLRPLEIRPV